LLKLAFSTLACPQWSLNQVIEAAKSLGYDAVELRLLDGDIIDPVRDRERVIDAVARCRAAGVEVCVLDTSCRFNYRDATIREQLVQELLHWIQLAETVHVPLLRIFGGPVEPQDEGQATEEEQNEWVAESLRQVAPTAEQAGIKVVLETHDAFSSAHRVARVLQLVNSDAIAALWDSHHPYRVGETAEEVMATLGQRIAHVHIKDARRGPTSTSWQLTLLGEGEVPVREQLTILTQQGYAGYASVEWEKRWHPEIPDPEIALPQHMEWLRKFFAENQA
jgi:sugar phosphate isomerase/epimerase